MSPSPVFFSDDLLTQFLSLLPVKSLLQFRCVSKSWDTLISDPNFVKFHHKRSKSRNPHLTLFTYHLKIIKADSPYGSDDESENDCGIIPYPIPRLLDNPSFTLVADPHSLLNEKYCSRIAGSCNGLICLAGDRFAGRACYEYWLRLWNPATRKISPKIGCFCDSRGFVFSFGCDNSTGTFKVVASRYIHDHLTSEVRVFSLGDNVWRNIESFPIVPLRLDYQDVFLNDTLNWLAIQNDIPITSYRDPAVDITTVEQIVIVSLDLGTETYNQYRLPQGFDEMPLFLSKDGDTLILCSSKEMEAIIYNWRDHRVERTGITVHKTNIDNGTINYLRWDFTMGYVESLVPIC